MLGIIPPTKHEILYKQDFMLKTQAINEKIGIEMLDVNNKLN